MIKRSPFQFHYQFQFTNGQIKDYRIALDSETLSLIPAASVAEPPEWVACPIGNARGVLYKQILTHSVR